MLQLKNNLSYLNVIVAVIIKKGPQELVNGEVYSCLSCGLELELHKDEKDGTYELKELELEQGEDWGQ